jgi:very-short-patch-repair endonuclease
MATLTRPELRALATHDVIAGPELIAAGVTRGQRRTLLRREHLFRVHEDVFFTTDRPTRESCWLAAVKRCGRQALLSFWSAAVLWRLVDEGGDRPHVTVPHRKGKCSPKGIYLHRTTRPDAGDMRSHIPVTTLHRTIDDVARTATPSTLIAILRAAERDHRLELSELSAIATSAKLRRALRRYVPGEGLTESPAEALFYAIVARTSLPRPLLQRRTAGGRADFLWPELKLLAEVDGYRWHKGRVAFREDRARDRANQLAGLRTLRFTYDELVAEPREVAADLERAAALAR